MQDILVYYSGHGAPHLQSRQGYLVPVDGNPSAIEFTGYALETLYKNLRQLKVGNLTVVLDTCFSGDSAGGTLFPGTSPARLQVTNPRLALDHAFVLTSSTGTQVANWYPEQRHGLFTYYVLLGLQVLGSSPAGEPITVSRLQEFLSPRVRAMAERLNGSVQTPEITGPAQTPMFR